jgi:hypothetical protein
MQSTASANVDAENEERFFLNCMDMRLYSVNSDKCRIQGETAQAKPLRRASPDKQRQAMAT